VATRPKILGQLLVESGCITAATVGAQADPHVLARPSGP
jgi:hypothetical protein